MKKKSSFWQFFDIQMAIFPRVSLAPQRLNDLNVSIVLKALHYLNNLPYTFCFNFSCSKESSVAALSEIGLKASPMSHDHDEEVVNQLMQETHNNITVKPQVNVSLNILDLYTLS